MNLALIIGIAVVALIVGFVLGKTSEDDDKETRPKRPMIVVTVRNNFSSTEAFENFMNDLKKDKSRDYVFLKVGANVQLPHEPFIREI